jgi:sulfatase modifying factor 1
MKRSMVSFARMPRVVFTFGIAALLVSLAVSTHAAPLNYQLVTVGNAGNANDPATGGIYGGVAYDYQIGKYDVTIGQYTDFLNAVATTDTYSLYNASMATDLNVAGIAQTGVSGSYTYSVINNGGDSSNRPITYVSWWDSARFANWMANGQPTGAQSSTTTENGAYNVNGATSGDVPAKNLTNPNTSAAPTFFIPNENEWYKAAYYSPVLNSGSGGYYTYATQSNTAPGNVIGSGANQANYAGVGVFSVTQSAGFSESQNYLTDVGAFTNSASFYGTFDQSGNVNQWNDGDGTPGTSRVNRGGDWGFFTFALSSSFRNPEDPSRVDFSIGFRLASPVAVPEPSTWVMGLAGLACGGWGAWRRRIRPSPSRIRPCFDRIRPCFDRIRPCFDRIRPCPNRIRHFLGFVASGRARWL